MYTDDMLKACPLVAVGSLIYKLRPVKELKRGDRGGWQEVEVLKPVGVPLVKATFDSEKIAQWVVDACNHHAEHLNKSEVGNELSD
jgi:hypothetical protein